MSLDFSQLTAKRLTARVHEALTYYLKPGDYVIDATVGNGHDTAFLAKMVAPNGKVFGFDIQSTAIEKTYNKLFIHHLINTVCLFNKGHEHMLEVMKSLDFKLQYSIQAILFNLGYLPGGNKTITTQTNTTVQALNAALDLLSPSGILSIMIYPGHEAGLLEKTAIDSWINNNISNNPYYFIYREFCTLAHNILPPEWIWIQSKRPSR